VGQHPADRSRFGLLDVLGNVSEWTADWYAVLYYKRSPLRAPRGPRRGRVRVVRGCSYRCVPGSRLLRRTARQPAGSWDPTIGLRCAGGPR
jgi:formylglycine-generating enzyme required for sulfatase activity